MKGGDRSTDTKLVPVRYGTTKHVKMEKSVPNNDTDVILKQKNSKRKFDLPKARLVRPQLKPHVCLNESNCLICKDFINKLDEWRGRKK